jgi:hypothetical protein
MKITADQLRILPRIQIPDIKPPKIALYADTFYDRLRHHIEEFQKNLKEDEQLAIYSYAGPNEPILITDIGYHNPFLINLFGTDSKGNECCVLAHMSSIQLVLKIEKASPEERKEIGFLT